MNNQDFAERASRQRNEELLRIVCADPREGFLPEAIEAAKAELELRQISTAEVDEITEQMQGEYDLQNNKDTISLTKNSKMLFAITSPLLIIFFRYYIFYHRNSYYKKCEDIVIFTALGLAIWGSIIGFLIFLF